MAIMMAAACGADSVEFDDDGSGGYGGSGEVGGLGGYGGSAEVGGFGGHGGEPPVACSEPICGSPANSIQCGCGPDYHPACDGLCDYPTFTDALPVGVTYVRLDPVSEPSKICLTNCNDFPETPAVTLTLRIPGTASCITVDGPDSLRWHVHSTDADVPTQCNGFGAAQCGTLELTATNKWRWLRLAIANDAEPLPNHGARISVEIGPPGTCAEPTCAGGCSGQL